MKVLVIAALLALTGCGCPDHLELDARWRPLVRIQKDAGTPANRFFTLTPVVLGDPCVFLGLSLIEQEAVLLHERSHALRQVELGLESFQKQYNASVAFRRDEELAGWKLQLEYEVKHGFTVDVVQVAHWLVDDYDGMVGYDYALAWVSGVVTSPR